jgi:tripartite-type tricarboxylate transporter receptor subunit TctC
VLWSSYARAAGLEQGVRLLQSGRAVKTFHDQGWRRSAVAVCATIASIAAFINGVAWSQERSIRLVVPYAAGSINETMFRVIADHINHAGGPTFLIESRPGAGTVLATDAVSRAAPDGNTILLVGNSFIINPHVRKLAYDPLKDFEPICYLWTSPGVFAVNNLSAYKTLIDLIAAARARPGALTLGASGPVEASSGLICAHSTTSMAAQFDARTSRRNESNAEFFGHIRAGNRPVKRAER